jgi:hypothetical protein
MTYRIENNRIVFDDPPREGEEIRVRVSTQNNLEGFSDPSSYYPRRVNEVDTNRLAVNDLINQHPVVNFKKSRVDDLTGEPPTPYAAQYPFNHVQETESGHIREMDDTPGHERIHEYHRAGTFYEIHPDGTKVTKIVGEDYEIVHSNKKLRVRGNMQVFVDGDASLYVRGSLDGQVDEDMTWNVGRNITFHAGQNIRMYSNQSTEITAQEQFTATSVNDMKLQTQANFFTAVDGDYKTTVKGNSDFIGDGYGVLMFGDDMNLITDTHMDINAGTTMNVTSNSAMDLVGSTIDLNKAGRAAAAAIAAPDIKFSDSRGYATYAEANNPVAEVDAPIQATVLPEYPMTPLPDRDTFSGEDDVEKSLDDIRAAVTRGEYLPTSFSDYSYNALSGQINVNSAMRRFQAQPIVPQVTGDHGDIGDNENISNVAAGNTTVNPTEQVTLTNGIDYNMMISRHFKLSQVSISAAVSSYRIREQVGLKEEDMINNLTNLATNALDLIKDQYPNMFVTSGFRHGSGRSQHNRGQAADMQFSGVSRADYYDIALWIRENVPHDQMLLEYQTGGSGNPWIHLSLKPDGNRFEVATFRDHSTYGSYGTLYQLYA